jgi:hypothetical protein
MTPSSTADEQQTTQPPCTLFTAPFVPYKLCKAQKKRMTSHRYHHHQPHTKASTTTSLLVELVWMCNACEHTTISDTSNALVDVDVARWPAGGTYPMA